MSKSILKYFNLVPSISQKNALLLFEEFLYSNDYFYILKGFAGSGKTTLLKAIINFLWDKGILFALCAPTGRAAKIITEKTGISAVTIHKMIYSYSNLVVSNNCDSEKNNYKFYFAIKRNNELHDAIIIVDESSMISDQYNDNNIIRFGSGKLLSDLLKYIDPENNNNKIIFMGDSAQLPPVKSNISYALSENYLKSVYNCNHIYNVELLEVFRQKEDSAILSNAAKLREAIEDENYNSFIISESKDEVVKISENDIISEYFKYYKDTESIVYNNIIITYSNQRAYEYNKAIRKHLFGKKLKRKKSLSSVYYNDNQISVGDILLITKNCYIYREEKDIEGNIDLVCYDLYNGEFVKVVEIYPNEKQNVKKVLVHSDGKSTYINLTFRDILIEFKDLNNNNVLLKVKIIENLLYSPLPGLSQEEHKALFIDFKERFIKENLHELEKIRRKSRRNFDIEQTELFKNAIKTDSFFNALHVKFGYAVTCHKAQGGEWTNVFVDFKGLQNVNQEMFFRWSYTAITRAKKRLFLINIPEYSLDDPFINDNYITSSNVIKIDDKENVYTKKLLTFKSKTSKRFYCKKILTNENGNQENIDICCSSNNTLFRDKKYFSENNIFLKELYEHIYNIFLQENIFISNVEHKQNYERYYFEKNDLVAIFDFYYKNNKIIWIQERETNSIDFVHFIKRIIENGI